MLFKFTIIVVIYIIINNKLLINITQHKYNSLLINILLWFLIVFVIRLYMLIKNILNIIFDAQIYKIKRNLHKFIIDYTLRSGIIIAFSIAFFCIIVYMYDNSSILLLSFLSAFIILTTIFQDKIQTIGIKAKEIDDEMLKKSLEDIARHAKVMTKIFVSELKSKTANACICGHGDNKKVIFSSRLMNSNFSNEEICALYAHELAHYKNNDNIKQLIENIFYIIIFIGLFILFMKHIFVTPYLIINLIYFHLYILPIIVILYVVRNIISRQIEYNADKYAANLIDKNAIISLLNKIEDDSLIKINKHPLYTFCVSTHPKIQDRILKINQFII
jgi:STE24 endopeptidase